MKLPALFVACLVASLVAVPVAARADEVLNPPGGPVEAMPSPQQRQKNRALKQALMQQFDTNGDGRLEPRERMRAVRVLQRIERKLAGRDARGAQQRPRMKKLIQRFDTNHDGTVDQSEMPPGAARKLRHLDRDRDGWVEPGEVR